MLLEGDAVDSSGLGGRRLVVGVDLENEVLAALLLLEDLESGILIAGGDDAVGDFLGDDACGGDVDNVTEGNDVAKAAHAIGTAGAGVGLGEGRALNTLNIVDEVHLALLCGQGKANGGTSGGDVLEAGGCGFSKCLLEFLDQGPGIQRIEKVDVAGGAAEDFERKFVGDGVGGSRLLVRVGAVSEGHVLLALAGVLLAEEARDGSVVIGRVLKGFEGISVSARFGDVALLELLEEARVVSGVAEDGDAAMVLGRGPDEGHASNVNLLDSLGDADIDLGNGVLEGVQVAHDIVDLGDALLGQILLVRLQVAGKDAAVDSGVQSLDTTTEHLGSLGDGADIPVLF